MGIFISLADYSDYIFFCSSHRAKGITGSRSRSKGHGRDRAARSQVRHSCFMYVKSETLSPLLVYFLQVISPALNNGCNYLSMRGSKLNHVSKRGSWKDSIVVECNGISVLKVSLSNYCGPPTKVFDHAE